ncbi:hypothetical protein GGI04_003997 [Coemansia thaxteri]|nr:hypothetical protein GGI04_003997 [Coemansia thaxteri]KAJ2469243.1 hypothetical protein GGI02_003452 [Coemansia sp. RSA 2322]
MGSANNSLRVHKPAALSIPDPSTVGLLQPKPASAGLATPATCCSPARRAMLADYSGLGLCDIPKDAPVDAAALNLSLNMLTQLPPGFGRSFSTLHILDISGNQVSALPEEISHLHCLRELYASRNALVTLPITIGSLRHLEVLDISENYIVSLDVSVSRLESLRMLNISDNRLSMLPSYLGLLAQTLRILLVDGNPFEKSKRDLVEPILTISSKEAKKIAKEKEKADKLREKAGKRGEAQRITMESTASPLHSNEYAAALRRLISVRLKRGRRNAAPGAQLEVGTHAPLSPSTNEYIAHNRASVQSHAFSDSAGLLNGSLERSPSVASKQVSFDGAAVSHGHQPLSPELAHGPPAPTRDSALIPVDTVANTMASGLCIVEATYSAPGQAHRASGNADACVTEHSEYSNRQLPPLPSPSASPCSPPTITADSARTVALSIARRIATGTSGSNALTEQDMIDMTRSQRSRYGSTIGTSLGLTDRLSVSSNSQESHGSSMDEGAGLIQDAVKVARVLWQLCDEWDLDPRHSEADSVEHMLAQLRDGNVRMDGVSGIDRVHREKASTAGGSQRLKILSELLVTEVTYVDTLKNVVGIYLNPMREAKILSETELREIFANIEVILAFHNDHFLPAITYAISQPDAAIGNVFLHHGAHLRLYSMYTNNHDTSVKTLSSVMTRRAVNGFVQGARYDVTQIGQVGLDGHLLTPVQRLPRYRMLLVDLLSNTPANHPDHEPLYMALKDLNRTIYEVNEKKRVFEHQSRLRKIQEKVAGSADIPLVVPHRVFKLMANFRLQIFSELITDKAGRLTVRRIGVGTVYRFFLFNDMIMQCTIIMNKDLRLNRVYKLGTRVTPAEVTCDNDLRVVDAEGVLYLKGDPVDIRKWAHEINSRLEA